MSNRQILFQEENASKQFCGIRQPCAKSDDNDLNINPSNLVTMSRLRKSQSFLVITTILLAVFSAPLAYSQACSSSPADQAKDQAGVMKVMDTFFAAARTDDLTKFHSAVTANFYAFDGGKRFNGDGLMDLIQSLHATGKVYVWEITDPEIHIECNIAWIAYVNRGSIQDASGKKDLSWLESAVLEKTSGTWRIRFLHSTRVP